MPGEGQNPVSIGAAGVDALGAVHPALEDFINRGAEVFDPVADLGRKGAEEGTGGKIRATREAAGMTATACDPSASTTCEANSVLYECCTNGVLFAKLLRSRR
jgi:hypothetical protein